MLDAPTHLRNNVMLITHTQLINIKIMSLHTGGAIGTTKGFVINPNDLQIIALQVTSPLLKESESLFLRLEDIRELSDLGLIVDSVEDLTPYGDVSQLDDISEYGFNPIGMKVLDERRHKMGKVINFTLDSSSFYIQQITVKRPLYKGFSDTRLVVHRTQIIEINNSAIVIHSEAKSPHETIKATPGAYVNPFRKTSPSNSSDI